jgi:hypothetical protein
MRPSDVAVLLAGIAAVTWAMVDVFQSVIVPRAPTLTYRISMVVWRGLWKLWPRLSRTLYSRNVATREEFLATFAPMALIVMILTWVVVLVLGYGTMLWALRAGLSPVPQSYWDAAYFAGTSLLTLGFGDVVARDGAPRFISLVAGATGFGVFSITTAYLFAIFGTFQRREAFIVSFAARAGAPPSGVALFEIAAETGTQDGVNTLMHDAQEWVASLMESHLAYPVLAFFRSSHDDQSWVGTLGALLDASLIADTILDDRSYGEARLCLRIARHAVHDLADFFGVDRTTRAAPGIARADFDGACDRLAAAGYALRDRDAAWEVFSNARAEYAAYLNAMARFFQIPPVAWLGGTWMPHAIA